MVQLLHRPRLVVQRVSLVKVKKIVAKRSARRENAKNKIFFWLGYYFLCIILCLFRLFFIPLTIIRTIFEKILYTLCNTTNSSFFLKKIYLFSISYNFYQIMRLF